MKLPYDELDMDTLSELSALITLLLMSSESGAFQPEYKLHLNEVRDELNNRLISQMNIPTNYE